MKNILLAIFILTFQGIYAQVIKSPPIRVKAGEDLYEKLAKEIYQYPIFTKGIVMFRDGKQNMAYLNYNRMNGEIQFIAEKGDTLSIANEETLKYVSIGSDSFYYRGDFYMFIAGNDDAKIVRKEKIKMIDQQKIGAYDQPSSSGAITTFNSLFGNIKSFNLDIRQDLILAKEAELFVGDRYNNFFRPNRKNLVKFFYKKQKEIDEYLKNNEVRFNNQEDLTKLLAVLQN